jgi:hypothetical protein
MDSYTSFYLYISVLFLAVVGGVYKLNQKDKASKVLVILLTLTLLSECTAHWAAVKFRNNMFVYHFFAPIQLILLGIYFDFTGRVKKRKIGLAIGVLSALVAIVNTIYFQPLRILNSNFLLFEGLTIMGLALYTFQQILSDDRIDIYRYGHFWTIVILIFFWSVTYTTWALYSVLQVKKLFLIPYISHILWAVNIITYSAMGFVLLYFSGKRLNHE